MTARYPFSGRFVLRDGLLNALRDRVESGVNQIRIVGGVGSGKTSLALQSLYQPFVHGRFPRGPVYVSLSEPNFTASIAMKAMDARIRKTRVSNFAQTAYIKGDEGLSAQGAGDNRGTTIRFGLAQVNLEAPRDGCIVILDDVSPLQMLGSGDSTRDLMTVFLNNIFPPDRNLYLSLMRPWDSDRIPYAEYGRPQDAVYVNGYSDEEVSIAWRWKNENVCKALYYNPLALTYYRALEDQGQITEVALMSMTAEDVAPWADTVFSPWAIACSSDHWSGEFSKALITMLALPDSAMEEESMKAGLEKWLQLSRGNSSATRLRDCTSATIRNDIVDLCKAGLIVRDDLSDGTGTIIRVSPLSRAFSAYWLRTRCPGLYSMISGEVERSSRLWSLNRIGRKS